MQIKLSGTDSETFVKRAFFLLYQACGHTMGLGSFQARDAVTEEDVWNNVRSSGDYPGGGSFHNKPQSTYADYVFGRMMKWGCEWNDKESTVSSREGEFRRDYQGFAGTYPNNTSIFDAAAKSLDSAYEVQ